MCIFQVPGHGTGPGHVLVFGNGKPVFPKTNILVNVNPYTSSPFALTDENGDKVGPGSTLNPEGGVFPLTVLTVSLSTFPPVF